MYKKKYTVNREHQAGSISIIMIYDVPGVPINHFLNALNLFYHTIETIHSAIRLLPSQSWGRFP